ncbi:MAG: ATP-grasp domain-containing protein [Eubacteriales bacterium]|nr:ATP-grasp domain-containing protein [Eubacteriales bacterium]
MNLLLTAIGSASSIDALKSLQKQGHQVYGCDIYPKEWVYKANRFADVFLVPSAKDGHAYVHSLLSLAKAHGIDMIIPLTDPECDVLCLHKALFLAQGIRIACQEPEVQSLCRNKLLLSQKLKNICTTIPSYTVAEEVALPFPIMFKPISGRSSQNQHIAYGDAEFVLYKSLYPDAMVQPFLPGNVYTVDCARDVMGNTLCYARKELLRTGNGLGTTVECFSHHALEQICTQIVNELQIVGTVNIEFIEHGDVFYFLEINPRFSGGIGFSQMGGCDFVNAHVEANKGNSINTKQAKKHQIVAQGYKKAVYKNE